MQILSLILWPAIVVILIALIAIVLLALFRVVVPTNEVHITQSKKNTTAYGRSLPAGNVYYAWPSFIPIIGITCIKLPTSIFDIELKKYNAYDIGRVPFLVDVKAFYQIADPETAAQRVESIAELKQQLADILRGAVRKILASADIEEILQGRGRFGNEFTDEVKAQLIAWGVSTVKNIEFMDIRDIETGNSKVIHNIMKKKRSLIESESRIEVANNNKLAELSEIEAVQETKLRRQEAEETVGIRAAAKNSAIGIADEQTNQAIKEQAKITAEKQLAVLQVEQEKQAVIDKNVAIISAEKEKEMAVLTAEAELLAKQKDAEGISVIGTAKADAEKAMLMAPVEAQIALLTEIADNSEYMEYLKSLEMIKAGQVIGEAQAAAIEEADVKIIANGGSVESGMNSAMDIFSAKGGTNIASMIEGLSQSDEGKLIVNSFIDRLSGKKSS